MPSNPPNAHEDLTIAETLETMRAAAEHRPGEECFVDDLGKKHWVRETEIRAFLRDHGGEHPSNFLSANGVPWTHLLFSTFQPQEQ